MKELDDVVANIGDASKYIREKIEKHEAEEQAAKMKIYHTCQSAMPDFHFMTHTLGCWKCDGSPLGRCVFDFSADDRDACVFCQEPNERK